MTISIKTCAGCQDQATRRQMPVESLCSGCRKKRRGWEWRQQNPGAMAATAKAWRQAGNKSARPEGYAEQHREVERARYQQDPEHREAVKARTKAYREQNPEKVKEAQTAWVEQNRDRVRGYSRTWHRANPERSAAIVAAWRAEHPEARARNQARRRAALLGMAEHVTDADLGRIMVWQQGRCFFCGTVLDRGTKTLDHVIPLARGGSNSASNCRWACRRCNFSRQDRLAGLEWEPEETAWTRRMSLYCHTSTSQAADAMRNLGWEVQVLEIQGPNGQSTVRSLQVGAAQIAFLSSFAWSAPGSPAGSLESFHQSNPGLILLWDWEWAGHQSAILASVGAKAGLADRLAARDCQVVQDVPWGIAKDFLDQHHIQGALPASQFVGLEHNETLVALLGLGRGQVLRFCSHGRVVGGLSRLLAHAKPDPPLMTYCEPRHGTGRGYLASGFQELSRSESASYGYMQGPWPISRYLMQEGNRARTVEAVLPGATEAEVALANGLRRLEGLAQRRFQLG